MGCPEIEKQVVEVYFAGNRADGSNSLNPYDTESGELVYPPESQYPQSEEGEKQIVIVKAPIPKGQ